MNKWFGATEWQELRNLAWDWAPLGDGEDEALAEDRYDWLLEISLRFLQHDSPPRVMITNLDEYISERFGVHPEPAQAAVFVAAITDWWAGYRSRSRRRPGG
jgi:hypothetical protein